MDELIYENNLSEVEEQRAEDIVDEVLDDNTIETPEAEVETEAVETTDDIVVETENPVVDETIFSSDEVVDGSDINEGETAEPLTDIETVEEIAEEVGEDEEPEDTPVIEEAVIPDYIRRAAEIGTRENPVIAPCGREVARPSLLQ